MNRAGLTTFMHTHFAHMRGYLQDKFLKATLLGSKDACIWNFDRYYQITLS